MKAFEEQEKKKTLHFQMTKEKGVFCWSWTMHSDAMNFHFLAIKSGFPLSMITIPKKQEEVIAS